MSWRSRPRGFFTPARTRPHLYVRSLMSSIKAAVYESELFGAAAPDVRKTASNVGALNELFHEMHGAQVPLDARGVVLWRDHKVAGHPREGDV